MQLGIQNLFHFGNFIDEVANNVDSIVVSSLDRHGQICLIVLSLFIPD